MTHDGRRFQRGAALAPDPDGALLLLHRAFPPGGTGLAHAPAARTGAQCVSAAAPASAPLRGACIAASEQQAPPLQTRPLPDHTRSPGTGWRGAGGGGPGPPAEPGGGGAGGLWGEQGGGEWRGGGGGSGGAGAVAVRPTRQREG